jgi:hypothetical protein
VHEAYLVTRRDDFIWEGHRAASGRAWRLGASWGQQTAGSSSTGRQPARSLWPAQGRVAVAVPGPFAGLGGVGVGADVGVGVDGGCERTMLLIKTEPHSALARLGY